MGRGGGEGRGKRGGLNSSEVQGWGWEERGGRELTSSRMQRGQGREQEPDAGGLYRRREVRGGTDLNRSRMQSKNVLSVICCIA